MLSFIAGFTVLFVIYHLPEFFSFFWLMALCKIAFVVVAFLIARWQGWKGLGGFGLGLKKGWWRMLLAGLLTGIVFFGLSQFLSVWLGYDQFNSIDSIDKILKGLPMILLMTVFPSIDEDILARGYLYGHLHDRLASFAWIFVSAAIFLLNHIWRLNDHPAVLAYIFFFGLALATAIWQKRNLWLAFGIHWGSNIAFETTNSFVRTTSASSNHESTWILAACWLVLFGILWIRGRRQSAGTLTGS